MENKSKGLLTAVVVLQILVLVCSLLAWNSAVKSNDAPEVDYTKIRTIVTEATSKIVLEVPVDNSSEESGDYSLTKSEYESEADEAEALELANAELDSRDLKKAIYDALVNFSVDIESYKDITDIKVKDVDVDGNEVLYDLKVYYYLDGDEDETEKARLNEITISINYLDYDDNYEDAEVDEGYLDTISVKKVYN